jgi:hypothetical protein
MKRDLEVLFTTLFIISENSSNRAEISQSGQKSPLRGESISGRGS